MYKWFYASNGYLDLPLLALAFFILFFLAVVFWVVAVKRPADFATVAALPLDDSFPSEVTHHEQ